MEDILKTLFGTTSPITTYAVIVALIVMLYAYNKDRVSRQNIFAFSNFAHYLLVLTVFFGVVRYLFESTLSDVVVLYLLASLPYFLIFFVKWLDKEGKGWGYELKSRLDDPVGVLCESKLATCVELPEGNPESDDSRHRFENLMNMQGGLQRLMLRENREPNYYHEKGLMCFLDKILAKSGTVEIYHKDDFQFMLHISDLNQRLKTNTGEWDEQLIKVFLEDLCGRRISKIYKEDIIPRVSSDQSIIDSFQIMDARGVLAVTGSPVSSGRSFSYSGSTELQGLVKKTALTEMVMRAVLASRKI
ncbi:MAG: hypothetical protein HQL69_18865 [Magnetococcales bacterium]|nr:hypothetical protein [Magnetococcales bacterium]